MCVLPPPNLSRLSGLEKLQNNHDWGEQDQAKLVLLIQLTGLWTVENYSLYLIGYGNFHGLEVAWFPSGVGSLQEEIKLTETDINSTY